MPKYEPRVRVAIRIKASGPPSWPMDAGGVPVVENDRLVGSYGPRHRRARRRGRKRPSARCEVTRPI
jgi:hypothetical protein